MMILVIGGSGSGKSSYAEKTAVSLSERNRSKNDDKIPKYYLATMQIYDDEGRRKVERHRKLRKSKGFLTIEQPTEIHRALESMESEERIVLLECISNLTANEMFSSKEPRPEIQVTESVIRGVELLKEKTTHLIVVSNNVFEDGNVYDKTTMAYIHAMGMINRKLAALAEQVVEIVAGIPVVIKS